MQQAWIGRVLDIDLPPYVEIALATDDSYRRPLRAALEKYVHLAKGEAWGHVRVRQKVRVYLASRGEWDALREAERVFDELGSIPPTSVRHGSVMLAASPTAAASVTLPNEILELADSETRLQVCLSRCDLAGAAVLNVSGWAIIRGVDVAHESPTVHLSLATESGRHRLDLPVTSTPSHDATDWVGWRHGSFERGGFQVAIDLAAVASATAAGGRWHLEAEVEVNGVRRAGYAHHAVAKARRSLRDIRVEAEGRLITCGMSPERGFEITVGRP